MSADAGNQLDLLGAPALETTPKSGVSDSRPLLGIALETSDFLQFLSSEWLFPDGRGRLLLGVGRACTARGVVTPTTIAVWFDPSALPNADVRSWKAGEWTTDSLINGRVDGEVIGWDGPLPAFAVSHYEVSSTSVRSHLLAMLHGFADIELPPQPILAGAIAVCSPPTDDPQNSSPIRVPRNWDALRGAAALFTGAVPAIDPWLDLLCDGLTGSDATQKAQALLTPWWGRGLQALDCESHKRAPPREDSFWEAAVVALSQPQALREWKPKSMLRAICERAKAFGEDESRLKKFSDASTLLLDDAATIGEAGLTDDHLALTLQLLLLRPSPDRFAGWREDWPAIPPGVWWTGMTLAGYLQGFQALPTKWRGGAESKKLLALRSWRLAGGDDPGVWGALSTETIDWVSEGDSVFLRADLVPWAEHRVGTRGLWYRASLDDPLVAAEAKEFVRTAKPALLRTVLVLEDASLPVVGTGTLKFEASEKRLLVNGRLELELSESAVQTRLDVTRFRDWIATASVTQRIRRPSSSIRLAASANHVAPETGEAQVPAPPARPHTKADRGVATSKRTTRGDAAAPHGLAIFEEFIGMQEEADLLTTIDALSWDTSMKRRVQHYGWKYDYKLRKVDPGAYLGPLPGWAQDLAQRLLERGIVDELPDQVIVNNYEGAQGISKHIDCPGCFRGAVVTLSLNESWEMIFSRKRPGSESERYRQTLQRRSAVVLAGEARASWMHEIPQRLKEGKMLRGRRVSITFRKVNAQPVPKKPR